MVKEVDVRKSLSDKFYPNESKIRYRVTDNYYLICNVNRLDELRWTFTLQPEESSKKLDYEVKLTSLAHNDSFKLFTFTPKYTEFKCPDLLYILRVDGRSVRLDFKIKEGALIDTLPAVQVPVDTNLWDDFQKYFMITDVTLIGSDGNVQAKMELLQARSSVFRTMFGIETSKEYQTKTVDMEEYTKAAIDSFVHFLSTGEMKAPMENASDLLLLADKYDVPSLKSKAERFLLDNVTKENAKQVYQLLYKVSPQFLEVLFVKTFAK